MRGSLITEINVDERISRRLAVLRSERGWTLDQLAQKTGISRATLSRIERAELSPTASILNKLCAQYGWTASRLMADAESAPPTLIRAPEQLSWRDPETGYVRRVVSPPHPNLQAELVQVELPPGATVSYDVSPIPGLEHHLWVLEGELTIELDGFVFAVQRGDCIRYILNGPSRFNSLRGTRYMLAMVKPK